MTNNRGYWHNDSPCITKKTIQSSQRLHSA